MITILSDPNTWISLLLLTLLEIILSVDNIVFLVVVTNRLPEEKQKFGRRLGLSLAMLMRLLLLAGAFWIVHLNQVLFNIADIPISWRSILFVIGGLFLMVKGAKEIVVYFHEHQQSPRPNVGKALFTMVIVQIVLFDIIFSLDSVMTAVAIAEHYLVMATAIVIAVMVMMIASEPLSGLIKRYRKLKLLALLFIMLIGIWLVLEAFEVIIPRYYLYVAMAGLAVWLLPRWFAAQRGGISLKPIDRICGLLMWLSVPMYCLGLFAPLVSLTSLWVFSNTVSVISGLVTLFNSGNYFIFTIIFLFAVLLPTVKLVAMMLCWYQSDWRSDSTRKILAIIEQLGRWSMLDVFMIALMVVIVRLGAAGQMQIHWGIYVYTGAILLMIALAGRFHYLVKPKNN